MKAEEREYLLNKLKEAKRAFSMGDIEQEQWLVEEAIIFVDKAQP